MDSILAMGAMEAYGQTICWEFRRGVATAYRAGRN